MLWFHQTLRNSDYVGPFKNSLAPASQKLHGNNWIRVSATWWTSTIPLFLPPNGPASLCDHHRRFFSKRFEWGQLSSQLARKASWFARLHRGNQQREQDTQSKGTQKLPWRSTNLSFLLNVTTSIYTVYTIRSISHHASDCSETSSICSGKGLRSSLRAPPMGLWCCGTVKNLGYEASIPRYPRWSETDCDSYGPKTQEVLVHWKSHQSNIHSITTPTNYPQKCHFRINLKTSSSVTSVTASNLVSIF